MLFEPLVAASIRALCFCRSEWVGRRSSEHLCFRKRLIFAPGSHVDVAPIERLSYSSLHNAHCRVLRA